MLVLFILALSMNLLGSKIEVWGVKRTVLIAMAGLAVVSFLLGLFLTLGISSPWIYVVFFSFGVGILSSVGWPSCLCVQLIVFRWFHIILVKKMQWLFQHTTVLLRLEISSL